MKFYQIKVTRKKTKPIIWHELLVPSGITFSQLYFLICQLSNEISRWFFVDEWSNKSFLILEFLSDPPKPDYQTDYYAAEGTFIDDFFREGRRLNVIGDGEYNDFRIDVETNATEYGDLCAPKVIKASRAVQQEQGNDLSALFPEELFEVKYTNEHPMSRHAELEEDLFRGRFILYASANPVTPEDCIIQKQLPEHQQRYMRAIESLMENDTIASYLGMIQESLDEGDTSLPDDAKAGLDRLMIREYGVPFEQYLSEFYLKEILGSFSPGLEDWLKAPIHVEDLFSGCTKKELLKIAQEEFHLQALSALKKGDVIKRMTAELVSPEKLEDRLTSLSDEEMHMFELAAARGTEGQYPYGDEEKMAAADLIDTYLAFPMVNDKIQIPVEIIEVYESIWDDEMELKRKKRNWMYQCIDIANEYYGVMPWEVLQRLFERRFPGTDMEEIKELFRTTPEMYQFFEDAGNELILMGFESDEDRIYLVDILQGNKPFYIPSEKEIEEHYRKGFLPSTPACQAMMKYLLRTFDCTESAAELKLMVMIDMINSDAAPGEVIQEFQQGMDDDDDTFVFPSKKAAVEFMSLYQKLNNSTRVMIHRGHTPDEMAGISKPLRREHRKVGRNEPCPCGSGKKYKHCCGKN